MVELIKLIELKEPLRERRDSNIKLPGVRSSLVSLFFFSLCFIIFFHYVLF